MRTTEFWPPFQAVSPDSVWRQRKVEPLTSGLRKPRSGALAPALCVGGQTDNGLYMGITVHSEIYITTACLLEASLWSPFKTSCLYALETCGEKISVLHLWNFVVKSTFCREEPGENEKGLF